MIDLAVYAASEEGLARVKERLEKHGIIAQYTTDLAKASRTAVIAAVMPHFEEERAAGVRALCEGACGVIVLTRAECYAAARACFAGAGAIVLKMPVDADLFTQSLGIAADLAAKLRRAQDEAASIQLKLDDLKLVDRAKCALIQYLRMTEPEAHRFIERQAMNKRMSKREVALEILKTYES